MLPLKYAVNMYCLREIVNSEWIMGLSAIRISPKFAEVNVNSIVAPFKKFAPYLICVQIADTALVE